MRRWLAGCARVVNELPVVAENWRYMKASCMHLGIYFPPVDPPLSTFPIAGHHRDDDGQDDTMIVMMMMVMTAVVLGLGRGMNERSRCYCPGLINGETPQ